MPLDPNVHGLMAGMAAAGRPKIWQLSPDEARQAMIALAQAVDVKDVPIGRIDNGTVAAPGRVLPYRLYTPVDSTKLHQLPLSVSLQMRAACCPMERTFPP